MVEGFNVHEGAIVLAAFYSTNHDEKVYKEPGTDHLCLTSKTTSILNAGLPLAWNVRRLLILRLRLFLMVRVEKSLTNKGGGTPDHGHKCLGEQFIRYHWFTITYLITCTIWGQIVFDQMAR